jgi:hypothetical protein
MYSGSLHLLAAHSSVVYLGAENAPICPYCGGTTPSHGLVVVSVGVSPFNTGHVTLSLIEHAVTSTAGSPLTIVGYCLRRNQGVIEKHCCVPLVILMAIMIMMTRNVSYFQDPCHCIDLEDDMAYLLEVSLY